MKVSLHYLFLLFIVFINVPTNTFGQGSGDQKFFQSFGFSSFTDYANGPAIFLTKANPNYNPLPGSYSSGGPTSTFKLANWSLSYYTITYQLRYNIHELSSNSSLSISAPLSLGLSASSNADPNGTNNSSYSSYGSSEIGGYGSLNVPLFFEFNYGNGATYSSDKDRGIVIGAGFEYVMNPIIGGMYMEDDNKLMVFAPKSWFQPAFEIGYRYWNRNNKAREINLKYGAGFSDTPPTGFAGDYILASRTVKLTFLYLLNY